MGDIIIRYKDFPSYKIPATTVEDENGDYIVFINTLLGYYAQRKALKHELDHIESDDFRNGRPIGEVEARARAKARE